MTVITNVEVGEEVAVKVSSKSGAKDFLVGGNRGTRFTGFKLQISCFWNRNTGNDRYSGDRYSGIDRFSGTKTSDYNTILFTANDFFSGNDRYSGTKTPDRFFHYNGPCLCVHI